MLNDVIKFPRPHVRGLMRYARKLARWNGHELGRWRSYKKWPWTKDAFCSHCGALATIETKTVDWKKALGHTKAKGLSVLVEPAVDFLTNEPSVSGDALDAKCPNPDAPKRSRGK
jgi:hypothetical protein